MKLTGIKNITNTSMNLACKHVVVRSCNIEASKDFYLSKLGLELLEDYPNFFVVRAGAVRFSVFGGFDALPFESEAYTGFAVIFATDDIVSTRDELVTRGVVLTEDIVEAPGFMRFITIKDPDGNLINVGQYLTDDMMKKYV